MSKWYIDKGEQGDIVLSTRIRLARNLDEFPFPSKLDARGQGESEFRRQIGSAL